MRRVGYKSVVIAVGLVFCLWMGQSGAVRKSRRELSSAHTTPQEPHYQNGEHNDRYHRRSPAPRVYELPGRKDKPFYSTRMYATTLTENHEAEQERPLTAEIRVGSPPPLCLYTASSIHAHSLCISKACMCNLKKEYPQVDEFLPRKKPVTNQHWRPLLFSTTSPRVKFHEIGSIPRLYIYDHAQLVDKEDLAGRTVEDILAILHHWGITRENKKPKVRDFDTTSFGNQP
ncbi:hypothetical protein QOT17_005365 [Balamuthia mandrillaris]